MLPKKVNKLVGLKKSDFDTFIQSGQITLSPARLIPLLKTGDEMALTSILLSSIRLVKEFRDKLFREVKLKRNGVAYFYTEACFKDVDSSSRIDGLIIVVVSGVIQDAAFIEVKNNKNKIDEQQILKYYKIAKDLRVPKLITVSNEFTASSEHSPVTIKNQSKKVSLLHFSWTYLQTLAQLLLFDNEDDIDDVDQIEIMREVLSYLTDHRSGVSGFHQMNSAWKEVADKIRAQQTPQEQVLSDAVTSWHQEEADMGLMLSRKLGVLVKSSVKDAKKKLANDIKKLKSKYCLSSNFKVKGAVSNIEVVADFERRVISMEINVTPPLDRGPSSRITWIKNQLDKIKMDDSFASELYVEAEIKHKNKPIRFKYTNIDAFYEPDIKSQNITQFNIVLINSVGAKFVSSKGFVSIIEDTLLTYYQTVVQNLKTWHPPAPKLQVKEVDSEKANK